MPRKPRVVIPLDVPSLIAASTLVRNAVETYQRPPGTVHDFLNATIFDVLDVQVPLLESQHSDFVASRSASEVETNDRNAQLIIIRDTLRQLRDYLFSVYPDDYLAITAHGFEVRQSKTFKGQYSQQTGLKPRVVIPGRVDQLLVVSQRVRLANAAQAALPGADPFLASAVFAADLLAAELAAKMHETDRQSKFEESQRDRKTRDKTASIVVRELRKARDYMFGRFPEDPDAAGEIGFTVIEFGGSSTDATPPTVPTGLASGLITSDAIHMDWNAAVDAGGIGGYRLRMDSVIVYDGLPSNFTATGLVTGTAYSFTVSAYDLSGNESAESAAVVVNTL